MEDYTSFVNVVKKNDMTSSADFEGRLTRDADERFFQRELFFAYFPAY